MSAIDKYLKCISPGLAVFCSLVVVWSMFNDVLLSSIGMSQRLTTDPQLARKVFLTTSVGWSLVVGSIVLYYQNMTSKNWLLIPLGCVILTVAVYPISWSWAVFANAVESQWGTVVVVLAGCLVGAHLLLKGMAIWFWLKYGARSLLQA